MRKFVVAALASGALMGALAPGAGAVGGWSDNTVTADRNENQVICASPNRSSAGRPAFTDDGRNGCQKGTVPIPVV